MKFRSLVCASIFSLILSAAAATAGKTTPGLSNTSLSGARFSLTCQVFESCDKEGNVIDTVSHRGDFILFSSTGIAYMYYQGRMDSLEYKMLGNDSLTFGDTPFRISGHEETYELFQNEEEKNGDFNRVTYLLRKESSN